MIEHRQDEAHGIGSPLLRQHGLELSCGDLWIACRELRPSAIEHSHRFPHEPQADVLPARGAPTRAPHKSTSE